MFALANKSSYLRRIGAAADALLKDPWYDRVSHDVPIDNVVRHVIEANLPAIVPYVEAQHPVLLAVIALAKDGGSKELMSFDTMMAVETGWDYYRHHKLAE